MGTTNPFGQNGVYDNNPEFNTLYKAGWMALFGDGHFGWKMTGVASMILAIWGMYVLGGLLGGRSTAIAAAGFSAASHYLFGLLNGGYNHLDALPVTIWTMVAFVLGLKKRDPWFLFLAGIGVGIGFYFHYSARIVGPVMLLVAMVSVSPREYLRLWPVIAGFLLAAWPTLLIARAEILTKMLAQTAAGYSEVVVGSVSERLISNVKLNLSAFHFNHGFAHLCGWAAAGSDHRRLGRDRNWSRDWKSKHPSRQTLFNLDRRGVPGDRLNLALPDNGDHPSCSPSCCLWLCWPAWRRPPDTGC